jgi:hypothetical protein
LKRFSFGLEHALRDRPQHHWFAILMCAIAGAFPIGIGMGVIPYDPAKLHAPSWVIVVVGAVFWLGGLLLLARDRPRAANGLAFVMLLLFSAVGAWVSLFGEEAAFSDGDDGALAGWGVTLARVMFGFGSLLCMLMALVALRRFIKNEVGGSLLPK